MSLGSIVVRLTMDTATFDTDAGRAAKIADKRAKEIDAAFRKAGIAIGAALGTAIVAATAALKSAVDHMDETSKAAQKVGDSTENFSRLVYAGSLADVSMEQLTTTMGKLTKSQAASLKASSEQAKIFEALGIEAKDAEGNLRKSSDVLLDFADRFKALKGSPEAMAAGFALFGRSFQDLIPLLKDGSEGIREAMGEADALGKTLSTEAGQQAEAFNDNLTRLQSAAEGLAMQIASDLLPDLVALTDNLVQMTKDGEAAADVSRVLSMGLDLIGRSLNQLDGIGDVISGISQGFWELVNVSDALMHGNFALAMNLLRNSDSDAKIMGGIVQTATGKKVGGNSSGPDFSNVRSGYGEFSLDKQVKQIKDARAQAEALRKALGDPEPKKKSGGAKKVGKTDEQREAEQLQATYQSLNEQQRERLALLGKEGEVAKVTYDTTEGSLKNLSEAQKQVLLDQAAQIDAETEKQKLMEEGRRLVESLLGPEEQINKLRADAAKLLEAGAISQAEYNKAIAAYKTPAQEMLEDLEFERQLLGKTREEQERLNAARYLGAEAATAQGQAALAALADNQAYARQVEDTTELMDGFRVGAEDMFVSIVDGSKSAEDAFKDFIDNLAAMLTEFIARKLIEQAFGQQGTTGQGTSGGNWIGTILGMFAGASGGGTAGGGGFGGTGWALGGYTGDGAVHQVAGKVHKGEVVWSQADIRRAGGVPAVEAMRRTGRGSSGPSVTNIHIQGRVSRQTVAQIDRANGRRTLRESSRTGA